ncbi:DUF4326 domain-containing protein [Amycolatopsis sp. NPDC048633]|uniref:DUF4326 domain-containing protein n=1 Tax=Amycolatopsis sp. NPDC048633 TaxID=3157095 RepID=UPI0033FA2B3A
MPASVDPAGREFVVGRARFRNHRGHTLSSGSGGRAAEVGRCRSRQPAGLGAERAAAAVGSTVNPQHSAYALGRPPGVPRAHRAVAPRAARLGGEGGARTPTTVALLPDLRGKRLGCWCVPQLCHARVIAELADHGP